MKKHGLVDAGYKHIILDDCFTLKNRSKNGKLVEDPDNFADGIKSFNEQLNKLGINGAAYSDLATWAEWGFGYVKYDNCYIPFDNMTQQNTHSAPFWLGLCEWVRWQQPWIRSKRVGQSWRINGDIKPWWAALAAIPDVQRSEIALHGLGATQVPLDHRHRPHKRQTVEILGNRDLIKINQDPNVGEIISPFRWGIGPDYSGPSSYGTVFMIMNTEDVPATMFFNLTESWDIRAGRVYSVYDMWSHKHTGTVLWNLTLELPAHGVAALLLNDAGPEREEEREELPYCAGYWQCSWPNETYCSN
ncbi:glycoside hydrolase [Mytilinidion resinicola]|uniref:alpha-galactosidase n=1 Tax=Mytilinidion resinicola TaxID=574789 RepID=A0A6A6Y5A2_9PEZI|nr:glycoside hydrolase [Mytilinidion resinicola]KAF2803972.1 glycoside hydrolase [Mytilinidion resinicola]